MLTLAIQAGGESNRMGQDKALLPFLGQPLIERVLSRVAHLADEILVTSNHPEGYRFLEVALIPDLIPGRGALGGLYTALKSARHQLVAVVACDMPFANPALLAACQDILLDTDADCVIPSTDRGLEPLHAVYRRATCLRAVAAAIESGEQRVISWHNNVNLRVLSPAEVSHFDPQNITFWNVNTPEDFVQAEAKAIDFQKKILTQCHSQRDKYASGACGAKQSPPAKCEIASSHRTFLAMTG
ncbi:MAG: molybdenum cofactor guanylyltransferase, partial [Chloroflexota bacterium]